MTKRHRSRLLATGLGVALLAFGLAPAGASSANISHAYQAESSLTDGSIVSLDPAHSGFVEPANTGNGPQLLGVVVASSDSLVAVSSTQPAAGSVQVATTGDATTLVSDLNGNINVGDQIAISPLSGVGMKAEAGSRVIGVAQAAFSRNSANAVTRQVTDKNGVSSQVSLGYIDLSIAITTDASGSSSPTLNGLQKLAQSITGRVIPTIRVVISLIVAIVALLSLVVIIYAAVYGSIISIGRNPLAKYAVFRSLSSVMAMALLAIVVASLAIFLLLR